MMIRSWSSGTRTIVLTVLISAVAAWLKPVNIEETLIKGQISNRFLRSFLYYVPYVTLAVMTFPSMIQTTLTPLSGIIALVIGIIAAWRRLGLFPVAAICCTIVYLIDTLII